MNYVEAQQFLDGQVRPVFELLTIRSGASLVQTLNTISTFEIALIGLSTDIKWQWPEDVEYSFTYPDLRRQVAECWPELGLYALEYGDEHWGTEGLIGDAVDDLTDIALDLGRVLEVSEKYPVGALSHLHFCHSSHFSQHIQDISRHLLWKIREGG